MLERHTKLRTRKFIKYNEICLVLKHTDGHEFGKHEKDGLNSLKELWLFELVEIKNII